MCSVKTCRICGETNDNLDFTLRENLCIVCRKDINHNWYIKNKEYVDRKTHKWKKANRELVNEISRRSYQKRRISILAKATEYRMKRYFKPIKTFRFRKDIIQKNSLVYILS
jgi:hypothetical protein